MPKINRGYLSVRENIIQLGWDEHEKTWVNPFKFRFYEFPSLRKHIDKFDMGTQLLGAFQPVVDAVYDAADTFRPYKSWEKVGWDLLQPIRGIANVLEAVGQLLYIPLFMVGKLTIMNISVAIAAQEGYKLRAVVGNTLSAFIGPISWLMNSATKLLRGLTQIATTPLSWLKIIARGFSTLENRGVQRLVDDRSVVRLVKQGEELQSDLQKSSQQESTDATAPLLLAKALKLEAIQNELKRKYQKAQQETAPTPSKSGYISFEEKPKRMPNLNPDDFNRNWLKFFKTAIDDRKHELAEIKESRRVFGKGAAAA